MTQKQQHNYRNRMRRIVKRIGNLRSLVEQCSRKPPEDDEAKRRAQYYSTQINALTFRRDELAAMGF